ncbi:MAG: metallopeptidase TldD-related protein [Myxococcota bacterium]
MHRPTRRQLLGTAAGGFVALSMPSFLAACARGKPLHALTATPLPEDPFLAWFGVDKPLLGRVLAELGSRGGDAGELYFQHTRSTAIVMEDGIVGRASTSINQGVGLRVVIGDQVGYAYTEDLTEASMVAAARTAAAIASRATGVVPPAGLVTHPLGDRYRVAIPWSEVGVADKLALIDKTEAMARAKDPAITKVTVNQLDAQEKVLIVDLAGNVVLDDRPMSRLNVTVTAQKDGRTQTNTSNLAGRHGLDWYTDERLQQVTTEAVDRTMILFDAVRPKAGEHPVVLAAGASGILLHEAIGHGMEADFNRKNLSIYSEMVGRRIAPEFVTIVDDGTQPGERGALNYDDEGTPAARTVLVRDGVLESYLHDRISARHYGMAASTGSGRRESFRHAPMPRMRSTYMENGPHTPEEILANVPYGIVAETFTNGQVQIGAGDFTFFVKNGWLIENGKITAPIKDVNIIGNGPEVLQRVTMVGNDSRLDTGGWTCGKDGQSVPVSQGMPTVLVGRMTVGGSDA